MLSEIPVGANFNKPGLDHIGWGRVPGIPNDAHPFLQSLPGEVSPHPTEAYDTILSLYICHVVSPYCLFLLPRSISGLLGLIHQESTSCFFAHKGRPYMSVMVVKSFN